MSNSENSNRLREFERDTTHTSRRHYQWLRNEGDESDSFIRGVLWGAPISLLLWGLIVFSWLFLAR